MFIFKERLHQKYRTLDWPRQEPQLADRYLGKPEIKDIDCGDCTACYKACPVNALLHRSVESSRSPIMDLGRCIFCGACQKVCPQQAFYFTSNYQLAVAHRDDLLIWPGSNNLSANENKTINNSNFIRKNLFKRSFKLREVSAGGCGACEADCNVLSTLVYDLGRFGIEFTASPRHADALVLTGPISMNMYAAFFDTWAAIPTPKLLIAVGACAISGGLFEHGNCASGIDGIKKNMDLDHNLSPDKNFTADIFIPGCPPNPWTILAGLHTFK